MSTSGRVSNESVCLDWNVQAARLRLEKSVHAALAAFTSTSNRYVAGSAGTPTPRKPVGALATSEPLRYSRTVVAPLSSNAKWPCASTKLASHSDKASPFRTAGYPRGTL